MAKNKNRKQGGQQDRSSQAERAQEQADRSSAEAQQSPMSQAQGSPAGCCPQAPEALRPQLRPA
jgi:hypothetical protein